MILLTPIIPMCRSNIYVVAHKNKHRVMINYPTFLFSNRNKIKHLNASTWTFTVTQAHLLNSLDPWRSNSRWSIISPSTSIPSLPVSISSAGTAKWQGNPYLKSIIPCSSLRPSEPTHRSSLCHFIRPLSASCLETPFFFFSFLSSYFLNFNF